MSELQRVCLESRLGVGWGGGCCRSLLSPGHTGICRNGLCSISCLVSVPHAGLEMFLFLPTWLQSIRQLSLMLLPHFWVQNIHFVSSQRDWKLSGCLKSYLTRYTTGQPFTLWDLLLPWGSMWNWTHRYSLAVSLSLSSMLLKYNW